MWTLYRLGEVSLGGSQATIDFSSIPQTFARLELIGSLRSDLSANSDSVLVSFNGDTTDANYDNQLLSGTNATASATQTLATTNSRRFALAPAATSAANLMGAMRATIFDYRGSNFKIGQSLVSAWTTRASGGLFVRQYMVGWASTAAITQITLAPAAGSNFVSGSKVGLYGIAAGV